MIKVNMGCGWRNFGDDWIHIDGGNYDHLDHHSITELPFEDDSVDLIYASHVLEYFDRTEVLEVLSEWYRVLAPGATLRLAVPDFEAMARLYCYDFCNLNMFLGPLYGKIEMKEDVVYHKTVYDFESLKDLMEFMNFENVQRYDWRATEHANFDDHSQAYIPHMDKENGMLISLNIECKKVEK
jgi:predicted SAM-dependent methyltransferase